MRKRVKNKKLKHKRKNMMLSIMGTSIISITLLLALKCKMFSNNLKQVEYETILVNNGNINNETASENIDTSKELAEELMMKEEQNYSYSDNAKEIEGRLNSWNFQRDDQKKVVYLTFDDGPSDKVTNEILDILDANDVKATFFVLGSAIEKNKNGKTILKRIAEEGHSIANHGYCHDYRKLYPNGKADVNFFMQDIKKSENIINDTLGYKIKSKVIRMPGGHGSWDTEELDEVLNEEGYSYIDWNTLNGDAESYTKSEEELIDELQTTVLDLAGNDDVLVVLMHDTDMKETTALSLDENIKYLKSLGYEFRTLK